MAADPQLNPTPPGTRVNHDQLEAFRHLSIPSHTVEILERFGLLEDKQFMCCMDLELTCWPEQLPDRKPEIIEIGIVVLENAPGLKEMSRISVVVKPEVNPVLSAYCTELTGITQAEVDAAKPLTEVWREVLGKLPDPKDFVWNTFGTDAEMLEQELADKGFPERTTDPRAVNTKLVYKALKGSRSGGLATCLACEGLTPALPRHRALSDALSLAALTRKLDCGPLDAGISNSSTYRQLIDRCRSQRVQKLHHITGLSEDTCAELLPLVNWDLRKAQQIYKLFGRS